MSVDTQARPSEVRETPAQRLYRLSVDQYHEMARAGVLAEGEPVELLEGLLVKKMTKNERHLAAVWLASQALNRAVPPGWFVGQDHPVVIHPHDEPEPDLTVIRGAIRDYLDRKPGPRDVELVVEVSDSSYAYDRTQNLARYARAAIPSYWIINLIQNRVEVYADPSGPAETPSYGSCEIFGPDGEIPLALDGREFVRIAVRDLLP